MPDSIYKVIELIGSSEISWDDAAKNAISRASKTIKDLRIAEVVEQDIKIEEENKFIFRTKLRLSFRYKD